MTMTMKLITEHTYAPRMYTPMYYEPQNIVVIVVVVVVVVMVVVVVLVVVVVVIVVVVVVLFDDGISSTRTRDSNVDGAPSRISCR